MSPATHDLCAVMSATDVRKQLPKHGKSPVTAVVEGDLAAILCPASRASRFWEGVVPGQRKRTALNLVDRQRFLEDLHRSGDILPARPGERLAPTEAALWLSLNARKLTAALDQVAGLEQHQILIRWRPDAALIHFRDAPELCDLLAQAPGMSRGEFGPRLKACGEALRERLGREHGSQIAAIAKETTELPLDSPEMLLNIACLTVRGSQDLDATLEQIDRSWPEGYRISVLGPSPAVSFASVKIFRPSEADLEAAHRTLGLARDGACDVAAVKRAQRIAVKAAHPDTLDPGADQPSIDEILAAANLLREVAALGPDDRRGGSVPPLAEIMRDGAAVARSPSRPSWPGPRPADAVSIHQDLRS